MPERRKGEWVAVMRGSQENQVAETCCRSRFSHLAERELTSGGRMLFQCGTCQQHWRVDWTVCGPDPEFVMLPSLEAREAAVMSMPASDLRARVFDLLTLLWRAEVHEEEALSTEDVWRTLSGMKPS